MQIYWDKRKRLHKKGSAYHLYGKPGNSWENSNGTGHPGGNFTGKKVIPFEVLPSSRFYRNDRNFLYHLFGLLVPVFMSKESEKFTGISCFRCPPKNQYHMTEIFHRNSRANGKRSRVQLLPMVCFGTPTWLPFDCWVIIRSHWPQPLRTPHEIYTT